MFNKLKQVKDLRSKAKKIQSTLAEEIIENTSKGISMTMDGNQNMKSIVIPDDQMQDKVRLEANLVETFNDTIKKAQKKMAMKLQKSGDFDLSSLG